MSISDSILIGCFNILLQLGWFRFGIALQSCVPRTRRGALDSRNGALLGDGRVLDIRRLMLRLTLIRAIFA